MILATYIYEILLKTFPLGYVKFSIIRRLTFYWKSLVLKYMRVMQ